MTQKNIEKQAFWKRHIEAARASESGIAAYCQEHGLNSATYYSWSTKIFGTKRKNLPTFVRTRTIDLDQGSDAKKLTVSRQGKPIDSLWLAEVLVHIAREISK